MNHANSSSSPKRKPTHDLLVAGELNVDLILSQVNDLPALEKERIAEGVTLTLGSSSAILASNAAALGLKVAFAGRIGHDPFGSVCLDALNLRGVDTSAIRLTDDVQTGLTCIFTSGNQRGMITYPGAMERFTIRDIPESLLASARHLHVSSYYLQTGLRQDAARLFRTAKAMGLSSSLDTNWDPAEEWADDIHEVLPYVDIFLPNDEEAKHISRTASVEDAIAMLSARCGLVVVTCGAAGIVARTGDRVIRVKGIRLETVDTVGAGDTFNAGFLSSHLRGTSLEDSIIAGILSSAFSTQRAGGTAAFDHPSQYHAFAETHRSAIILHEEPATIP